MEAAVTLTRYRVALEALETLDLPVYLGSTLRGAFGQAFRRLACPARDGEPCPIPETCPYELIFNTRLPPDAPALRTYDEIPRPFVIAAPPAGSRQYPAGSEVAFDLTLIGRARQFFPHFVVTLREVDGLGRGRRAVRLRRIDVVHPLTGESRSVYTVEQNLVHSHDVSLSLRDCSTVPAEVPRRIHFLTQTRLKHGGAIVRRPEFHVVFRALLRRLSSLSLFHCENRLDVDYKGLIEQAKAVRLVADETRWIEWARFSARQGRRMTWGGFAGAATYEGDLRPFWPYLVFGQWTHVGKGATFGLGQYRLGRPRAAARTT
ncbi:MAG: CRISPR system precrRNA processing endoribonuclease RAMP protein Cas6 [Armatimonadetes bacterium]|nr:CRISPR system precrRNA processing endoribonuclease RAMP protein Cas6 [Armatimonadota bacterium]